MDILIAILKLSQKNKYPNNERIIFNKFKKDVPDLCVTPSNKASM